jgi:hypothetical protein
MSEVSRRFDDLPRLTAKLQRRVDALERRRTGPLAVEEVTSGTAASLSFTVPAGIHAIRIVGHGRSNAASTRTSLVLTLNGVSTGLAYRTQRMEWTQTTPNAAAGTENTVVVGHLPAASGLSAVFGWVNILLSNLQGTQTSIQWEGGAVPEAADTDTRYRIGHGRFGALASTIQLAPGTGSFVAGTRYELRPV